jgi:hypothetical protein
MVKASPLRRTYFLPSGRLRLEGTFNVPATPLRALLTSDHGMEREEVRPACGGAGMAGSRRPRPWSAPAAPLGPSRRAGLCAWGRRERPGWPGGGSAHPHFCHRGPLSAAPPPHQAPKPSPPTPPHHSTPPLAKQNRRQSSRASCARCLSRCPKSGRQPLRCCATPGCGGSEGTAAAGAAAPTAAAGSGGPGGVFGNTFGSTRALCQLRGMKQAAWEGWRRHAMQRVGNTGRTKERGDGRGAMPCTTNNATGGRNARA